MDCEELTQLLSEHHLTELTGEQRAAVGEHLAGCAACRAKQGLEEESQALHDAAIPLRARQGVEHSLLDKVVAGGPKAAPGKRRRLGGFELLGRLGTGGMGTVLKARQLSMDRLVALKILPRRLAESEAFVARFLREARSAARLYHPHIVRAYDVGQAGGYYYFAMEYIDGEGLNVILAREGRLEPTRALRFMKQVCNALAAAHKAGVIHRDVKPSNLMLDRHGDVRVTDFGLAKITEGDGAITTDGQTLGSPAYVSPEMAAGKEVDARADLYSLGAAFYHLLAGQAPFEGGSLAELLIKHVNETPPPLSQMAPHVDRRLCRIIDRLLEKNPEERAPSAHALLGELEALGDLRPAGRQAGVPASTVSPDGSTPTLAAALGPRSGAVPKAHRRRPKRRTATSIIAASIGLLLAAVAVVVFMGSRPAVRPETSHPATANAPKSPQPDPRERRAEAAFRSANDAAGQGQWRDAKLSLDALKAEHGTTKFYTANTTAIDALLARVSEALSAPTDLSALASGRWVSLFDGKTLDGWRVADEGWCTRHGQVSVDDGRVLLEPGRPSTGIVSARSFPAVGYEVVLDATRLAGTDVFCGVVFPVGTSHCWLLVGGWGGSVVGLDQVDGRWANNNLTTTRMDFQRGQWYRVRLRVTQARIEAWIDEEKLIDLEREGHSFTLSSKLVALRPLGVCSYQTTAALRDILFRRLELEEDKGVEEGPRRDAENPKPGQWQGLFDGKSLRGWRVEHRWGFGKHGEVTVEDGQIALQQGEPLTGVAWTSGFPALDYEVELEAKRVAGDGDFANITFPVGSTYCTFHTGCWADRSVGLSKVDDRPYDGRAARGKMDFEDGRWYRLRVRVTRERIQCWIDDAAMVALALAEHRISPENGALKPFGVCSWGASSALRNIRLRRLDPGGTTGFRTATVGGEGGSDFEDRVEGSGYLVGFRYSRTQYANYLLIESVEPLYRTPAGLKRGGVYGRYRRRPAEGSEVVAKAGYAVGALVVPMGIYLDRFKIIFMRVRGGALDPRDTYESDWLGGPGGDREITVGGSGTRVVGIHGRATQIIDALGLIELGPTPGFRTPWAPVIPGEAAPEAGRRIP